MVGVAVVSSTKEPQVGHLGLPPIGPVLDVVGIAPAGGDLTAGVGAVAVPKVQGFAESG